MKLNQAEATHLADVKAQSLGFDLRQYTHSLAQYDAADGGWWVNYRRTTSKPGDLGHREFNILVKDKTKEAWLVLP